MGGAVLQKIEDTVADVLDAMRKRGIGDYSIKCTIATIKNKAKS